MNCDVVKTREKGQIVLWKEGKRKPKQAKET
jgi:hypothetical protein